MQWRTALAMKTTVDPDAPMRVMPWPFARVDGLAELLCELEAWEAHQGNVLADWAAFYRLCHSHAVHGAGAALSTST